MRKLCPNCNNETSDSFDIKSAVPDEWPYPEVNKVKLCSECGFIWYDNYTTQAEFAEFSRRVWIKQFASALTANIR